MTNITFANATLQATINPNGLPARVWFEWGTNASYGSSSVTQDLPGLFTDLVVTNLLTPLSPGQEYHFRAVVSNNVGSAVSPDRRFFTFGFSNTVVLGGMLDYGGSIAWGDFDRDSDLDLLVTAFGGATNGLQGLYQNNHGGFSCATQAFGCCPCWGILFGSIDWGDSDNDGDLDILLAGSFSYWNTGYSPILRNDGGVFTNSSSVIPALNRSTAAWGDYNNDGFADFTATGTTANSLTNVLCRNNGDGTFVVVPTDFPAVVDGGLAWGDFDNDGQLDLVIMGNTGTNYITRVFRNNNGTFTDISANLPGVCCGSVSWGDYDNDGQLDLLLLGQTTNTMPNSAICRIYRNVNGTFTDIGAGLPGIYGGTAAWGDVDSDGNLDIAVAGKSVARVYRNDGGGLFSDINAGLTVDDDGTVAWGDYDNDGALDLAVVGHLPLNLFRNLIPQAASNPNRPSAPSNLSASAPNNSVTLHWTAGIDPHTPTPGLTYNVRVGTTPGGSEIGSPQSNPSTGKRFLPKMGNAEHRLFTTLTNLPVGLYYWSVQTINNGFVGSAWATEQTFVISNAPPIVTTLPASNILCCSAILNGTVTPGLATRSWFEWGTNGTFGSTMPLLDLEAGLVPQSVQQAISNLQPRTKYFFRLVATNSAGVVAGAVQSFTSELPAPEVVSTLGASNVTYSTAVLLGSSALSGAPAEYFIEWGKTAAYGQLTPATVLDAALGFDGVDDCVVVGWGKFPDVTNNFTIELWANPAAARALTPESTTGVADFGPQRLAVFPEQGAVYGDGLHAGVGLSVGTNGISVLEHRPIYLPAVLVYSNAVSDWNHIAVVYSNHLPMLYLNAVLVRTGLVSAQIVHPSAAFGGATIHPWVQFWPFAGGLQEIRIWDTPLNATTLQAWMNRSVNSEHPAYSHLQGYWPLNEGHGTTVKDLSPRNNAGQLVNGTFWTGGRLFSARTFSAVLNGLSPGTTYYFRAVAMNSGGTVYGSAQTFMTLPAPRLQGIASQAGPNYSLQLTGLANAEYILEMSTNLRQWIVATNLTAGADGCFQFMDTTATNVPTRFYRLRVQ